jgi:hypothetical protein
MDGWIDGQRSALGGLGTPRPRLETMRTAGGTGERVVVGTGEAAQGREAAPHGRRHRGPRLRRRRGWLGCRRSEQELGDSTAVAGGRGRLTDEFFSLPLLFDSSSSFLVSIYTTRCG